MIRCQVVFDARDQLGRVLFFPVCPEINDTIRILDSTGRVTGTAIRDAYRRVWGQFVDQENENEKLRPVVAAISTAVRHVIDTHYIEVK